MTDELWGHRALPCPGAPSTQIWCGAPETAAELTDQRVRLRGVVPISTTPAGPSDDDVDRLLLAFEELGSNGLRHGRPPVQVCVTATDDGWVLDVIDADVRHLPTPALDRDAASGGLGLYLIARLAAAHGWDIQDGRKHVWAVIAFEPAAAPISA